MNMYVVQWKIIAISIFRVCKNEDEVIFNKLIRILNIGNAVILKNQTLYIHCAGHATPIDAVK